MSFLLQRDTCTACIRKVPWVTGRVLQHQGALYVSAVTVMTLELWLTHWKTPSRYLQTYAALMQGLAVLSVDESVAHRAAGIGTRLRIQGRPLNTVDLLIAATALEHSLTLVTHVTQVYASVPGLAVVDWLVP